MKKEDKRISLEEITAKDYQEMNEMEGSNDLISLLAINELLNVKKIKSISRIKPEQVATLSKLFLFAEEFKVPFAKTVATNILELMISIKGLGRKEMVQLVQKREEVNPNVRPMTTKDIFR